eukprot:TRINITY_DN40063_c0_g1_i1.p1 TRINITY_DN40063_c0_g1~~TRINITY_DN40063_c0_g1_i1.p1  ORF type:complete len:560 (+),score=134.30 TRINITY_DN40063_c0_g1_i1:75-1682(+)
MSMDRLVELFLQSSRPDGEAGSNFKVDDQAIAKGLETVENMLLSEDGMKMMGNPDATFVCLGMALEEKPMLGLASIGCYEKALHYLGLRCRRSGSDGGWERCVVLQQLGAVSLRMKRYSEAHRWLEHCSEACTSCKGHPREADLFNGAFNTQQTRLEFLAMVEKHRAKAYYEDGNQQQAMVHVNEAQRLEAAGKGDAVERQEAQSAKPGTAKQSSASPVDAVRELWASEPAEERRLKQYSFMDEGPTVLLLLELNEHLGIGTEASAAVESLRQFKVTCKEKSVDIQLRLRRSDGRLCHFRLLLDPLSREIVPEDTVPRLRGKEGKRRLEIKLFKREKGQKWIGDLVAAETAASKTKPKADSGPAKGSILNPLTPEEIAALPKPSDSGGFNRPSSWQGASQSKPSETSVPASTAESFQPSARATTKGADEKTTSKGKEGQPSWVAQVERDEADNILLMSVQVAENVGDVSMKDLELDVDEGCSSLRIRLAKDAGMSSSDSLLQLNLPSRSDMDAMAAKWKKKTRTLEIRIPQHSRG